jgi:glucose 1-dehydrogenase
MTETPQSTLKGQSAVITGASSGIGRAAALALAERGTDVLVNYKSDAGSASDVAEGARERGVSALALEGDVSSEEEVSAMVGAAVEAFGGLDILVANAGVQKDAAFTELSKDDWDTVIAVNLTGAFLSMQAAVRQFRRQGRRGSRALGKIIVMSSVHDVIPWAGHVNYAAAKGGVAMLMKTAAQELASEGIRVNAVSPGAIATAINEDVWQDPAKAEALREIIPAGRIGDVSDVAEAVVWLASDASDYVTGHSIVVDGGMTLYPSFRENG